jgi:Na+-driven multidrug efflux pump
MTMGQPRTNKWDWMWREVKEQLDIACPDEYRSILQYSILVVSDMFVGHLGERELASGSTALTFDRKHD